MSSYSNRSKESVMTDLTVPRPRISWIVWLILLLLSVIGLVLLVRLLPFSATGDGGSNGDDTPCKNTYIAIATLEASVSAGVSYFEPGGIFFGIDPLTMTRDNIAQHMFGSDYRSLPTLEAKQTVLGYNQNVGNMTARYTEWLDGDCWKFTDITLMGRLLKLFNK